MRLSVRTTRGIQIIFLVMLATCAAQIGWWMLDAIDYTGQTRDRQIVALHAEVNDAEQLAAEGVPKAEILSRHPSLSEDGSGGFRVRPEVLATVREEAQSRMNRFGWEGGFFLVILAAGTVVVSRSLWQQVRLRKREENFLAAVSHELKSPLASIRLATETLEMRDPGAADRERWLGRILSDVERLETMVSNILDTGKLDEGGVHLEPEDVSLHESVSLVVNERPPHGTQVDWKVPADLHVRADPEAVRTVIRNLVDNADKAVKAGDGKAIQIRAQASGRDGLLSVTDDGVGFSQSDGMRLFDKFYRQGDELRRDSSGAGLGLFIVRRLVELDRGKVRASSEGPGRGASFEVRWPRSRGEES